MTRSRPWTGCRRARDRLAPDVRRRRLVRVARLPAGRARRARARGPAASGGDARAPSRLLRPRAAPGSRWALVVRGAGHAEASRRRSWPACAGSARSCAAPNVTSAKAAKPGRAAPQRRHRFVCRPLTPPRTGRLWPSVASASSPERSFRPTCACDSETRWTGTASQLFTQALDTLSPTYGAAFDTPDGGIASLSPELFLRRRGEQVCTGPIKGTIVRAPRPGAAAAALARLEASAKDAAEHVMIVDLMRNDLGRVCSYGTIRAPREPPSSPTRAVAPGLPRPRAGCARGRQRRAAARHLPARLGHRRAQGRSRCR